MISTEILDSEDLEKFLSTFYDDSLDQDNNIITIDSTQTCQSQKISTINTSNNIAKCKKSDKITFKSNESVEIRKCMIFPVKLLALINKGNIKQLDKLINESVDLRCLFVWNRSLTTNFKSGSSYLSKYFQAYLSTSPDATMIITSIKKTKSTNRCLIIKCLIKEKFTPVFTNYMDEFFDKTGKKFIHDVDHYTVSNNSFIQTYNNIELVLYFNKSNYKLVYYEENKNFQKNKYSEY